MPQKGWFEGYGKGGESHPLGQAQDDRLDLANDHKDQTVKGRKEVIFSHETKNNKLSSDWRKWAHKLTGEGLMSRLVHDTLKFGGGLLMVWGRTSWNGTGSACKIDGRMDGDLCIKVLEEELMPSIGYLHKTTSQALFQQDNDPKHACKKAKDWFKMQAFKS